MTATLTSRPDIVARHASLLPRAWQVIRWTTLALWLGVVVTVFAVGNAPSTYGDLLHGLRTGTIGTVRIDGAIGGPDGIPPTVEGEASVRFTWRDRWGGHYVDVIQSIPPRNADTSGPENSSSGQTLPTSSSEQKERIVGRVDTPLRAASAGRDVDLTWRETPSSSSYIADHEVPGALLPLALVVAWGLLFTLFAGPEPRWATRWGWLWLSASGIGVLATPLFLVLGARPTHRAARRLNGWWAFLVLLLAPRLVG